jgi:hypothetical protein
MTKKFRFRHTPASRRFGPAARGAIALAALTMTTASPSFADRREWSAGCLASGPDAPSRSFPIIARRMIDPPAPPASSMSTSDTNNANLPRHAGAERMAAVPIVVAQGRCFNGKCY